MYHFFHVLSPPSPSLLKLPQPLEWPQDGHETESMKLLKNILPESIITRMQQGQKFVADSHNHVAILFSE
jgi:hypothetical protein